MGSSWLKKQSFVIGHKPPLNWLILFLISLLALIAVLSSSSSPLSSSKKNSSRRTTVESLIYTSYRRIEEQAAVDYLELRAVSSAGGARQKEVGLCRKERENFVPCHNVSANLVAGFKDGEEFDRHCEVYKGTEKCLVRPPKEYKAPLQWPAGRDVIWSGNVKITKDQFLSSGSMTKRCCHSCYLLGWEIVIDINLDKNKTMVLNWLIGVVVALKLLISQKLYEFA